MKSEGSNSLGKENTSEANYTNSFLQDDNDVIEALDMKKDPGPMMISANSLQYNSDNVFPILLNIFNSILQTGIVPFVGKFQHY